MPDSCWMSKKLRRILIICSVSIQILHFFNKTLGQDVDVTVSWAEITPQVVHVDGRFLNKLLPNSRNFVLLREYAGIDGLASRANVVWLKSGNGDKVGFKKLITGEYLA